MFIGRALLAIFVLTMALPLSASASTFSDAVRGRILLDVEQNGEAWYVYPQTMERYFLGRPDDAFSIMSALGLGISDADLEKIPLSNDGDGSNLDLRERLSGRILLQVEEHGEAWYVFPSGLRRYYLGRPRDAFQIMSDLGLGITSANLARIPIAKDSLAPPVHETSAFRAFTLTNGSGSFPVSLVTLSRDAFQMITDTADPTDCTDGCATLPLLSYVTEHGAFAGIHGTYFCPPEYASCADKTNTFLPPVYNTSLERLINADGIRFFNRPLIEETTSGDLRYFHRANTFVDDGNIQAAIGNWPSLVENGVSVVAGEPMEDAFLVPGTRGGIGWNADSVFLLIANNATMEQFASIFVSIGADEALNLDGGGSAALFYDGAYRYGPGRNLPNAIVFRRRP